MPNDASQKIWEYNNKDEENSLNILMIIIKLHLTVNRHLPWNLVTCWKDAETFIFFYFVYILIQHLLLVLKFCEYMQ